MIRFIARKTHNRYFIFICSHPLLIEDQPQEKKTKTKTRYCEETEKSLNIKKIFIQMSVETEKVI